MQRKEKKRQEKTRLCLLASIIKKPSIIPGCPVCKEHLSFLQAPCLQPRLPVCRAVLVPKCIKCTYSLDFSALKCRATPMRSCTRLMARSSRRLAVAAQRLAVAAQRLAVALQRLAKLTRNQHAVHLRKATWAGLLPLLPHHPPCHQSLLPSSRLRLGETVCINFA